MKKANYKSTINPLLNLKNLVTEDLDKVDELIYSLIASKIDLIPQISSHTISSGGKRLRPILTLATAKMCGYSGSKHIDLAACVEFMHTATLLHDDVVDKSDLRRGKSTANNLWGNKESILVGDYLLGKSFQLMEAGESLQIYKTLADAAVIISEGEVMQLAASGDLSSGKEKYIEIISAKTAKLFAAACQVGGLLAQRSQNEINALGVFGLNLGIAFQIVDDLLDYFSNDSALGKNIGNDFLESKITLPVILSYKNSSQVEKKFWKKVITKSDIADNDLQIAIEIMKKQDIFSKVVSYAYLYVDEAQVSLNDFDESSYKSALLDVLNFTVQREF